MDNTGDGSGNNQSEHIEIAAEISQEESPESMLLTTAEIAKYALRSVRLLENKLDGLQKEEDKLKNKINEINEENKISKDEISKKLKEVEVDSLKQIEENKDRVTTTLAIFVSLFTFISINFSFFANKELTPLHFFALDLLLSGTLIILILLFRLLISQKDKDSFLEKYILVFAAALVILGILIMVVPSYLESKDNFLQSKILKMKIDYSGTFNSSSSGFVDKQN